MSCDAVTFEQICQFVRNNLDRLNIDEFSSEKGRSESTEKSSNLLLQAFLGQNYIPECLLQPPEDKLLSPLVDETTTSPGMGKNEDVMNLEKSRLARTQMKVNPLLDWEIYDFKVCDKCRGSENMALEPPIHPCSRNIPSKQQCCLPTKREAVQRLVDCVRVMHRKQFFLFNFICVFVHDNFNCNMFDSMSVEELQCCLRTLLKVEQSMKCLYRAMEGVYPTDHLEQLWANLGGGEKSCEAERDDSAIHFASESDIARNSEDSSISADNSTDLNKPVDSHGLFADNGEKYDARSKSESHNR